MGVVQHCRAFYDEIWLVPVFQHAYATKRELAPFAHRVAMCRVALETLMREQDDGAELKVVEDEREMFQHVAASQKDVGRVNELRLGSVDLVHYLRSKHQDTNFTMLLGGDTYADLLAGKWNRGDELMQLVKFVVVDRKGVESTWRAQEQQRQMDTVRYIHVPELSDVSSTSVRATANHDELAAHLDPAVLEYIVEHQLYAFATTPK